MQEWRVKLRRFVNEHLVGAYTIAIQQEVTPQVAQEILRRTFGSLIRFILEDPDHTISLPGVGTFHLHFSPPRVVKGKLPKLHGHVSQVPRLKWRVAKRVREGIIQAYTGVNVSELETPEVSAGPLIDSLVGKEKPKEEAPGEILDDLEELLDSFPKGQEPS